MKQIGRNDPCHCGSGKKYKNCHMGKDSNKGGIQKSFVIIGVISIIIVAALVLFFTTDRNGPPGPAPEGKVWSYEHGHWHNK